MDDDDDVEDAIVVDFVDDNDDWLELFEGDSTKWLLLLLRNICDLFDDITVLVVDVFAVVAVVVESFVGFDRPNSRIISDKSLSASFDNTVINCEAIRVTSVDPRIITIRSPCPFCFSTSICAPDISRIVLILQPARPITRLIAFAGTNTFFDFLRSTTSFQPSSRFISFIIHILLMDFIIQNDLVDIIVDSPLVVVVELSSTTTTSSSSSILKSSINSDDFKAIKQDILRLSCESTSHFALINNCTQS
ncbi:hypothetical protein DERP_012361 [Dermatophagoides pteronyssinus]|uniref:Uncharacterized protein n=1 Tax=Dermatophagoides pteronyssinus TaxID=6956 RepID=A0ABQ8IUJ2_DERPT|nr:hypothetical protein DERP_012361 [Dermatophagoides pteronyssinus]